MAEVRERSGAVYEHLLRLDVFRRASAVWTYVSSKPGEVDTRLVIESALAQGRPVACPAALPHGLLAWRMITRITELVPGLYDIWEPHPNARPVPDAMQSTVVLVPGIAFTQDCHRVGFGGGYFDRFLADFAGVSIGLCYDFQVVPAFPTDPHDIALDYVVSESKVFASSRER
jgi:5-formyltetrahydrofolate cyclo-ligase